MPGSMSFTDKSRKYEEMLKKIQNIGDPSVCGGVFDSRLGITANRIDSTLSTQQFYGSSNRSSKQNFYKTNERFNAQSELSVAQREDASMSQKSYPQTFDKITDEFCSAPSISGSLQYAPSGSFAFKVPVPTKAFKQTRDDLAQDKYMTRINLNLQVLRAEHKIFMKFMASLVESGVVACRSIQQGSEHIPDFNFTDLCNSVVNIFTQHYGQTSSKKCFSDASSVTTNSTYYNNDFRGLNPVVQLQRASSVNSRSRAPSQLSRPDRQSRRSQSHSPRIQETTSQIRPSNPKRSLSQFQLCEERDHAEESSLSLFSANNSRIAQLRDQRVLQEAQAAAETAKQTEKRRSRDNTMKPTPLPKSKNNIRTNTLRDRKVNTTQIASVDLPQQEKSLFEVPTGAKAVTRTGRPVKSPVKWWGQGTNDSKLNNTVVKKGSTPIGEALPTKSKSCKNKPVKHDLNESIVLRNSKIVGKPPTDFENIKKLTSLTTVNQIHEKPVNTKYQRKKKNEDSESGAKIPQTKKKSEDNESRAKKSQTKKKPEDKESGAKISQTKKKAEDKENVSVQKKPQKVPTKPKKVKDEQKEKSSKTVGRKRKSEENVSKDSKRKKCEEQTGSLKIIGQESFNSSLEDDDIFGGNAYKKTSRPFIATAVSPTTGMLSAKKDAAAFLSKETPPCKAITQFMNNTCQSAASSYNKEEVAKQDAVVKRVTQKVKTQKNVKPIQNQAKSRKVTAVTSENPCTISLVLGNDMDQENDEDSDFSEDDDLL